jgi:hypothetical protein
MTGKPTGRNPPVRLKIAARALPHMREGAREAWFRKLLNHRISLPFTPVAARAPSHSGG